MKISRRALVVLAFAIAALGLMTLAGCSTSSGYTIDGGKVDISGKTLTVTLDSNASTGYEWTMEISGSSLEETEESTTKTESTGLVTGSSSNAEYKFEGVSAGDSTITFTYARSWETTSADKTVVINVTTDSSGKITHTDTTVDGKSSGESNS